MTDRTFFLGNRVVWAIAGFAAPLVLGATGSFAAALVAFGLLAIPSFVIFDTDRSWWSDEVRSLPMDEPRNRAERRALGVVTFAGVIAGTVAGVAVSFL